MNNFPLENINWKQYEVYIFNRLRSEFPNGKFARDVKRRGVRTGQDRQIDILVETSVAGFPLTIAIDCKCYGRKIDIKDVEAFLSMASLLRPRDIQKGH